jgi:hypothetical protein
MLVTFYQKYNSHMEPRQEEREKGMTDRRLTAAPERCGELGCRDPWLRSGGGIDEGVVMVVSKRSRLGGSGNGDDEVLAEAAMTRSWRQQRALESLP